MAMNTSAAGQLCTPTDQPSLVMLKIKPTKNKVNGAANGATIPPARLSAWLLSLVHVLHGLPLEYIVHRCFGHTPKVLPQCRSFLIAELSPENKRIGLIFLSRRSVAL